MPEMKAWNSGTAKKITFNCEICGDKITRTLWQYSRGKSEKRHICIKSECRAKLTSLIFKGKKKNPNSIKKMVATRKARGNYGWTDEFKTIQSQKMMGRKFTDEHKEKISLALKGRKYSIDHRQHLSHVKEGKISNSEEHNQQITNQIETFKKEGFLCVRIDRRPLPDFVAIKDNRAFAVEVEGGILKPSKYIDRPHDYADIFWIQFRRNKNANRRE
jgi:hypothetical protein